MGTRSGDSNSMTSTIHRARFSSRWCGLSRTTPLMVWFVIWICITNVSFWYHSEEYNSAVSSSKHEFLDGFLSSPKWGQKDNRTSTTDYTVRSDNNNQPNLVGKLRRSNRPLVLMGTTHTPTTTNTSIQTLFPLHHPNKTISFTHGPLPGDHHTHTHHNNIADTTIIDSKNVPTTQGRIGRPANMNSHKENDEDSTSFSSPSSSSSPTCAILFFGLPRAFKLYVLPSIIENIIQPNIQNNCDYYFHYFHLESEGKNRGGAGGRIYPQDVYQLQEAVKTAYEEEWKNNIGVQQRMMQGDDTDIPPPPPSTFFPHVSITNTTMDEFWTIRGDLIHRYESTLDDRTGKYLYFPTNSVSWEYPESLHNVIKQWHSIDAVWKDMEYTVSHIQQRNNTPYDRVMMLRNDVAYVTPINVYGVQSDTKEHGRIVHRYDVVIPNWANHPINDRMIIGPYNAVEIWATQRFQHVEEHVQKYLPGWGIHSERYLNYTIFPIIQQQLLELYGEDGTIRKDPTMCFLRTRSDGSVWLHDCVGGFQSNTLRLMKALLFKYHAGNNNLVCTTQKTDAVIEQLLLVCNQLGNPNYVRTALSTNGSESRNVTTLGPVLPSSASFEDDDDDDHDHDDDNSDDKDDDSEDSEDDV
jgi:hypothetical protein